MRKQASAFSLVEVVLALGIVSFALISMMALVPIGLGVHQDAQTATVQAEIVRQISSELQHSPWPTLFDASGAATAGITGFQRFYDVEGRDVTALAGASLPVVYTATLQGAPAEVGGAPYASTGSGVYGTSGNGITTAAGKSLAQIIRIHLAFQNRSDIFSILVVNKGY